MIATLDELDGIRRDCRRMVTRRALTAAGAVVVPLPGADIVADVSLMSSMLPAISRAFELDHAHVAKLDPAIAERVLVLAASMGNTVIGRLVTRRIASAVLRRVGVRVASASAARYVPILGSALAASIGFGAMKLAGNTHIEDCYRTAKALLTDADGQERAS